MIVAKIRLLHGNVVIQKGEELLPDSIPVKHGDCHPRADLGRQSPTARTRRGNPSRTDRAGWFKQLRLSGPIGLGAVMGEDLGAPAVIGHIRPVILVESGSTLKQLLIGVQYEFMLFPVNREGAPRNGK